MLSSYQFGSNRPIDVIDIDGFEFLKADDAKVEFRQGELQLKVVNFNFFDKNIWENNSQNPHNWTYTSTNGERDFGISRTVGIVGPTRVSPV